ncbi:MAG: MoaD/ThiS family protein [Actinomycetaceae bacterium]|nr:MoaD/ThiS family protein [Actinomycetaceae bacterium]
MIRLRYFAGIGEQLGTAEETYPQFAGTDLAASTLADLKEAVIARHGDEVRANLDLCAFMANGQRLIDDAALAPVRGTAAELVIDALPPFAGG